VCHRASDEYGEHITLRRLSVRYDAKQKRRVLYARPDEKVDEYRDKKYGNKPFRVIMLDLPEQARSRSSPTKKFPLLQSSGWRFS
jgi:hypothetical protein